MSILDVWITPESALVGVDTETFAPDGTAASISKMIPLPHMNAVLACRGHVLFFQAIFGACHASGGNFDALLDKMPELLRGAFSMAMESAPLLGMEDTSPLDNQTIVLVGWSLRQGRMIGREYVQESREIGFMVDGITPYHLAPWDQSLSRLPDPKTPADMGELAKAQTQLLHDKAPGAAAGGRFLIAEISRQGMKIEGVCDLPARRKIGVRSIMSLIQGFQLRSAA